MSLISTNSSLRTPGQNKFDHISNKNKSDNSKSTITNHKQITVSPTHSLDNQEQSFNYLTTSKQKNTSENSNSNFTDDITEFFTKHENTINTARTKMALIGSSLHALAAVSPFISFVPKELAKFSNQAATIYSRYVSAWPAALASLPLLASKENFIKAVGTASPIILMPFFKDVAQMPMATSLYNLTQVTSSHIADFKGLKYIPKNTSIKEQLKSWVKNYTNTYKSYLNNFNQGNLSKKISLIPKLILAPSFALCSLYGPLFCRNQLNNPISKMIRSLRGLAGNLNDLDLIADKNPKKRLVGQTFMFSSTASMFPPWIKDPNIKDLIGQSCKAIDEIGNLLWSNTKDT